MSHKFYLPKYENSWALVVGINNYKYVNPLHYATDDAKAVANILDEKFGFPKSNTILLLDNEATKKNILNAYFEYTNRDFYQPNDRIFFFFAGHGHTVPGNRGDIGFLVPRDGKTDKLGSLIRWDDLTKGAELIPAKHMFFIMDACYGGLALSRGLAPGSKRFLKDMVQRYVRQVLTAGKSDEPVSDSGGPLPNHSVFTGHLLEGLNGKAASRDGTITANGIMSYVYDKVSKDYESQQTPHYGFLDGDGDFIINTSLLDSIPDDEPETDKDVFVEIPYTLNSRVNGEFGSDFVNIVKEYLSDEKYRIRLDDFVVQNIKKFKALMSDDKFSVQTKTESNEDYVNEFIDRLNRYNDVTYDLERLMILLSYWGKASQIHTISRIFERISEIPDPPSGYRSWTNLRWYPVNKIMYAAGIAALSKGNYDNLYTIFYTNSGFTSNYNDSKKVIVEAVDNMTDIYDEFKKLPGHERNYAPRSEYLFKQLQPNLNDLIYIGSSYEEIFDRFEIFQTLVYADLNYQQNRRAWGPPGRFVWKFTRRGQNGNSPFTRLKLEATSQKNNWSPLKAGFFGGEYEQFEIISNLYEQSMLTSGWF